MSRTHPAWDSWYDRACWRKRAAHQLRVEPLCRKCAEHGEVSVATVVDHIEPHNGDWNRFRLSPVQSLCKPCHDGAKRFEELRGFSNKIGPDGLPVDKRHPFYTGTL